MLINSTEELNLIIEFFDQIKKDFPNYYIKAECGSDSDMILIGVYGVEKTQKESVQDYIFDFIEGKLDGDYFQNLDILPMVRTDEITEQYYPEIWNKLKNKWS